MGLDQYGFKRKQGEEDQTIQYWRKHANLEGWMADLYAEKYQTNDEFNCKELELTEEDLLVLQDEYLSLERASGFFWGESTPEDDNDVERFIREALKALKEGYQVYYTSWW